MYFFPKRGFSKHALEEKQQLGLGQWALSPSLGSLEVPSYKIAKVARHSTAGASSRFLPSSTSVSPALQHKGTESSWALGSLWEFAYIVHVTSSAWLRGAGGMIGQ